VSALDGRILQVQGNCRRFLNVSDRFIVGRDIYLFIDKERVSFHRSIAALSPNVTIERDLTLRPRDRKPFLGRALITRQSDTTVLWQFSSIA